MNKLILDPGSFRDPKGKVFLSGEKVFRAVSASGKEAFEFVQSTGFLSRLERAGKIVSSKVVSNDVLGDLINDDGIAIEHEKIPFISYPYEWSFPLLKEAALLHLDIHLQALDSGVTLSDASAYNVQFRGCQPIFIDILSFRKLRHGEAWEGHRQFCEQFLNPLLMKAKVHLNPNAWYRGALEGITPSEMNRLLPWHKKINRNILLHVVLQASLQNANVSAVASDMKKAVFPLASYRKILISLMKWIEKLEPKKSKETEWENYSISNSYANDEKSSKQEFIAKFSSSVSPNVLWDLGCNAGEFSRVALENGSKYSIGFDFDHGSLDLAFNNARQNNLQFLPLFLNATNPSPNQGWNESERKSMSSRCNADGIIALAFLHHLVFGRNVPLQDVVTWLVKLAPQGVIEFVPKSDPMIKQLLRFRDDIFSDYSEEAFVKFLSNHSKIVESKVVTESGRKLFWFNREVN